jgi:hypothetical protein
MRVLSLISAAALLLALPELSSAQWKDPTPSFQSVARRSASNNAAVVPALAADSVAEGRSTRVLKHTLTGTLIGAAVGVAGYLVVENTVEHWDHSEDSLVFFSLTVPGAAIGTVVGLIVGVVRTQ